MERGVPVRDDGSRGGTEVRQAGDVRPVQGYPSTGPSRGAIEARRVDSVPSPNVPVGDAPCLRRYPPRRWHAIWTSCDAPSVTASSPSSVLLRHLPRAGLRQHVPRPRPRGGQRRCDRPGRVGWHARDGLAGSVGPDAPADGASKALNEILRRCERAGEQRGRPARGGCGGILGSGRPAEEDATGGSACARQVQLRESGRGHFGHPAER
jgi:hypothetical protein